MTKIARRYAWLFTAFFKQYYPLVITSLVFSISLGVIMVNLKTKLPPTKKVYRIGIIGLYSSNNLPQLVKTILNAGLTRVGNQLTILPNLSSSWVVSEDGQTYDFKIKPNLKWNNGLEFKTSQIKLSIPSVKILTPDDQTISFVLPDIYSPFPSILTNPITDKDGHLVSDFSIELTQSSNGNLTKIELTSKNLHLIFKIYPNSNTSLTAYKIGEVDAIYGLPDIGLEDLSKQGATKTSDNLNQSLVIYLNTKEATLKNKFIRQALAYALSDKSFGRIRSLGPISPLSWSYNPLVKPYDSDLAKAAKLIKDATKNEVVSLELATNPTYLSVAENIKRQLEAIGISADVKVVTAKPENYQLYLTTFDSPADPDQYIYWHSTQSQLNKSKLDNEKIDKLLEDGRRALSIVDRKRIYAEFQRTFSEELPAIFLFHPRYLNITRTKDLFDIIDPTLAF